ncbi:MAG: DUF2330 domain-containing protein [Ktedonobacteraceae bacterium]|nr:DUF2330 domain-containing protein [Ktedonobacteraceae bacterium]
MLKKFAIPILALVLFMLQSQSAFACGGLVAPNGSIRLARATTLVAWHDGIEHYMTSFAYQGDVSNLGWIVPLPAVPTKIEEGGAWTLQRLAIETHPRPQVDQFAPQAASNASGAQVLQRVKVEALNIVVLKGSGQEVLNWVKSNGFFINNETRDHLLAYAQGSPIFMAAKFDTTAARARHQLQGDGTPLLITMKTPHIWVPLEVLALDGQEVQADLYLLTDMPVNTSDVGAHVGQSAVGTQVPGAPGFQLAFQETMNDTLFHDLSTDRNMGWVPRNSWLTYLTLDAPDSTVTYDLGVSSTGLIHLAHYGTPPLAVVNHPAGPTLPAWLPSLPLGTPQAALIVLILLGIASTIGLVIRSKARSRAQA